MPISGESLLKAFQLSLFACGLRMFLGKFRVLVPRSATTKHWKVVHKVVEFFVDKSLRDINTKIPGHTRRSLLDGLVQQTNDKLEIRNQVIQGLTGSLDTTAMLVSNTVFLLSRSPDVWDRLRSEVASAGPDALTIEDTRKFKLLSHILRECK